MIYLDLIIGFLIFFIIILIMIIYLIYKVCIHIHYLYFTKPTHNNKPIIIINKPNNTCLTPHTTITHNTVTSRTNLSVLSPKAHIITIKN